MTQEEKWVIHYNEVKTFIETYHRNPSKYVDSERGWKIRLDLTPLVMSC